ncbi:MAG: BtaA family protein [Bacteroidota bacterium]
MSRFQNWIFHQVHGKKLIYNTCWEDPRCDRKLLNLQSDSRVVMITSAGDNALDYLLDDPAEIHSVDMNYRQNALLELKRSVLRETDHQTLFQFFGQGANANAKEIYEKQLHPTLPNYAQEYWDKHINYFSGKGWRKSFYYRGASGMLAFFCRNYLWLRKVIGQNVEQLLNSKSLREQIDYYAEVEAKVFTPFIRRILNSHYTMCLAGVPKAQQALIQQSYEGGNVEYIQACLRNVFTELTVEDNYFYQVYFRGAYTEACCPEYLKPINFSALQHLQNRISTYNVTLSDFLQQNPGTYSHYILLDHQDWLAAHDVPALEQEWQLILKNSQPGTRILLRSAAIKIDFFPAFVKERVYFDDNLTKAIHKEDRVGTYASVYLGIVK